MKKKIYNINKNLIFQVIGKESTIFDTEESVLHTFNESATFIFLLLKKGWNKEKIILTLIEKFNIEKLKADGDFNKFLTELKKKKILIPTSR